MHPLNASHCLSPGTCAKREGCHRVDSSVIHPPQNQVDGWFEPSFRDGGNLPAIVTYYALLHTLGRCVRPPEDASAELVRIILDP